MNLRRRYTDRIEVWQGTAVSDGYGGNDIQEAQIGRAWAEIKTIRRDRLQEYGLDITKLSVKLVMRSRVDIDYNAPGIFFKFKGSRWSPTSITDLDLEGQTIEIICTNN